MIRARAKVSSFFLVRSYLRGLKKSLFVPTPPNLLQTMPSSKRNRGRARKAKAREKQCETVEDFSFLLISSQLQLRREEGGCLHGWKSSYVKDPNCCNVLETAINAIYISENNNDRVGGAFEAARAATDEKFPSLYKNNAATLEMISQALLCIGAELLLDRRSYSSLDMKAKNLFRCATTLAFSEYLYQSIQVKIHGSKPLLYFHKIHDLICSDQRRMVSYLRKRIPCSCLDAKFSEVKAHKKMSICNNLHCFREKVESKALLSCERCRKAHYCSQRCQASDWLLHKHDCLGWKKWEKLQKKGSAKGGSKSQDESSEESFACIQIQSGNNLPFM